MGDLTMESLDGPDYRQVVPTPQMGFLVLEGLDGQIKISLFFVESGHLDEHIQIQPSQLLL
jgi:hypothetical protein